MFELWARKRTTEGVGSSFELIFPFDDLQLWILSTETFTKRL